MVHLRALPYWAKIGSAVTILGAAYFLVSAVIGSVTGMDATDVVFDFLLAGAFLLLACAVLAKVGLPAALGDRRSGPLGY